MKEEHRKTKHPGTKENGLTQSPQSRGEILDRINPPKGRRAGRIYRKGKCLVMSEVKQKLHEIAPMIFGETPVLFAYFDFLPVIHQYQKAYRERALRDSL
jgi:hypothetical protein